MSIIKLDYDKITTRDIGLIFNFRGWLLKYFDVKDVKCYETKRGYHVRIKLGKTLDDRDIQMMQILMGSDIHREIFNFLRRIDGQLVEEWNKLYTKKYLVLGTRIKEELSGETFCPVLQETVEEELRNAKDLRGYI